MEDGLKRLREENRPLQTVENQGSSKSLIYLPFFNDEKMGSDRFKRFWMSLLSCKLT